MKTVYTRERGQVKAGYTIRMYGRVWHVRMTHLETLNFLRRLCALRRAA